MLHYYLFHNAGKINSTNISDFNLGLKAKHKIYVQLTNGVFYYRNSKLFSNSKKLNERLKINIMYNTKCCKFIEWSRVAFLTTVVCSGRSRVGRSRPWWIVYDSMSMRLFFHKNITIINTILVIWAATFLVAWRRYKEFYYLVQTQLANWNNKRRSPCLLIHFTIIQI